MKRSKKKKIIKESAAGQYLRQFINCICEGEMAQAHQSLDSAVKEKIKERIRINLKESK